MTPKLARSFRSYRQPRVAMGAILPGGSSRSERDRHIGAGISPDKLHGMQHVIVRRETTGYWLDPQPYLGLLAGLTADLPPGAREFALDAGHYDFYSNRCVKDLVLQSVEIQDSGRSATLAFAPNSSKHDEGLLLRYAGVSRLSVSRTGHDSHGLGSVLLDEVLPAPAGVSHEIAMTGGVIALEATDVEAIWGS
jgi:hypothetical protein